MSCLGVSETMEMSVHVIVQIALKLQRVMVTGTWQLFSKEADGELHQTYQLSSASDTIVSKQTVYRCLGYTSLHGCKFIRCISLAVTLCCLCLAWSREYAI